MIATINPKNRFIVEFGAGDGTNFSFARRLIEQQNFSAFLIEADPELSKRLIEKYRDSDTVKAKQAFLRQDNIVQLFKDAGVPHDLAVLCIDIDGNDLYMWKALAPHFRADVVCIEYNAAFGPVQEFAIPYDDSFAWKGDDFFGASFATLMSFAKENGYSLIHVTSAGDNLVFVRNELASKFSVGGRDYFQIPQYGKNGRAPNGKGHPASPKTTTALERIWFRLRYRLMAIPRKIVYAARDPKGHAK